jgi:hypothetical protein
VGLILQLQLQCPNRIPLLGIAASAASLVAMAGDTIEMPGNTFMLIHKPSMFAWGSDDDMAAALADLRAMNKSFASTYASRSGKTPEWMLALMSDGALLTAADCKQMGLADSVSDAMPMTASYSLRMIPESARKVFTAALTPARVAPAYGRAEILETLELCRLADADLRRANEFIAAKTPLARVRDVLAATVALQRPPDSGDRMADWRETQEKVRTEFVRH